MQRRALLLGLGGLALSACAPSSSMLRVYEAYRGLKNAKENYPVSRAEVEANPYALIGAQVTDGLKGLLVLRKQESGLDTWESSNGVVIVTRAGRLIRTVGFPQDQIASVVVQGEDPLGQPLDPSRIYRFTRQLDLSPDLFGLTAEHELHYLRDETVVIMELSYNLALWEERVRIAEQRSRYVQRHGCDPKSGQIWQSTQQLGAQQLTIDLLKPAG